MAKKTYMIQISDLRAGEMLQDLAKEDIRSFASETAYLIRKEWFARFGCVSTESAPIADDSNETVREICTRRGN